MLELNIFSQREYLSQKLFKDTLKIAEQLLHCNIKGYINLIFVGEKKIAEFNKRYRKRSSPTDVLSFSYDEECLGEILICPSFIRKRVEKGEFEKEILKAYIHGLLHLFGFDHTGFLKRVIMEKKEREILKRVELEIL